MPKQVDPATELKLKELQYLKQVRARESLMDFIPFITPTYVRPVHLAPLINQIQDCVITPKRCLSSVPPRHGKTESFIHAIVWLLLNHPEWTIGYATYAGELAVSKSRRMQFVARNCGITLAQGSRNVREWRTPEGGGVLAQGLDGVWNGQGVQILIVDDPYKGMEEAQSEVMRAKSHEWFETVASIRVEPGGSIFVNHTRWHQDDLIGWLELQKEDPYYKINMPALNSKDEALWEERWSAKVLKARRANMRPYNWNAIYQGTPIPPEGALFRREWFDNTYDKLPETMYVMPNGDSVKKSLLTHKIMSVDGAWTEKSTGDFSVIATWGMDDSYYYLIDLWRGQVEYPDLLSKILDIYQKESITGRINALFIENTASGIAAIQSIRRDAKAIPVIPVTVPTDKVTRATKVLGLFQSGLVKFPKNSASVPWLGDYISEMCYFPNSTHDDQVDATSQALDRMAQLRAGAELIDPLNYNNFGRQFPEGMYGR